MNDIICSKLAGLEIGAIITATRKNDFTLSFGNLKPRIIFFMYTRFSHEILASGFLEADDDWSNSINVYNKFIDDTDRIDLCDYDGDYCIENTTPTKDTKLYAIGIL